MMNHYRILRFSKWIISRLTDEMMCKTIMEDLEYRFIQDRNEGRFVRACIRHSIQCFVIILPVFIDNLYGALAMFKNYIKIALRNLRRHKTFSLMNISGLALGMACAFLILLWVDKQLSYDSSHLNKDRIVRLEEGDWAHLQTAYRKVFDTFPEIEKFVQFSSWETPTLRCGGRLFDAQNLVFADDTIFDVFTFSFLSGNPETALLDPYSLVLSQSEAKRLFGLEDPMGKTVIYENRFNFSVTGIVKDPIDFHLEWRALAPFRSLPVIKGRQRFLDAKNDNFPTYFLLREHTDVLDLEKKLGAAINAIRERPALFRLRPFKDIYFARDINQEKGIKHGNMSLVILFSAVAVLILLIACVNFINLVTARYASRAKEISIRKTAGALRKNLIVQFFGESALTVFTALALAILLAMLFLPSIAHLTGEPLKIDWTKGNWLSGIICIFLFTTFISGFFPAVYLSSLNPISLLKGKDLKQTGQAVYRKILTIFQFSIAIFLIIGALSVLRQLNYVNNMNLGFNRDQILLVPLKGELIETPQVLSQRLRDNKLFGEKKAVFKQRLLSSPDIRGVTFTGQVPGTLTNTNTWIVRGEESKPMIIMQTDPDFLDVMGLELVDGRNLSWDLDSDLGLSYMINEASIPYLGLDPPVGKMVRANFGESRIIGVIKDFHFRSLHHKIGPMAIVWFDGWTNTAVIKMAGRNIGGTIEHIRAVWSEICPNDPFSYTFMNETIGRLYEAESRLSSMIKSFVAIAVFLSCLGLFGLSAYVAKQKTKEIGIRKVLGARDSEIVVLLTKDFTKWVLLGNLFAWPVAYIVVEKWLRGFAYRMHLSITIFIFASLLILCIALFTVSFKSIKAAKTNPMDSLRHE